jgi:hypothetical protein
MKKNKAVWELLYCFDGLQYRPLKSFVTTAKRTGGQAAREYREKLLKTPKYQGKEEVLWVERYVGPDGVEIIPG